MFVPILAVALLLVDYSGSRFVSAETLEPDRLPDDDFALDDDLPDALGNVTMDWEGEEESPAASETQDNSSPTVSGPPPIDPLGRFQVIKVGGESPSHPAAVIHELTPFMGELYFEASQDGFEDVDQLLFVEIWARVPEGQTCGNGNLVTGLGSATLTTSIEPYDDYSTAYEPSPENGMTSYPRAPNGRVGKAMFTIDPNVFDLEEDQRIFFPKSDSVPDSSDELKFCIRVATKLDYTGDGTLETIAYIDTNFLLSVEFVGKFSIGIAHEDSDGASSKSASLRHAQR